MQLEPRLPGNVATSPITLFIFLRRAQIAYSPALDLYSVANETKSGQKVQAFSSFAFSIISI